MDAFDALGPEGEEPPPAAVVEEPAPIPINPAFLFDSTGYRIGGEITRYLNSLPMPVDYTWTEGSADTSDEGVHTWKFFERIITRSTRLQKYFEKNGYPLKLIFENYTLKQVLSSGNHSKMVLLAIDNTSLESVVIRVTDDEAEEVTGVGRNLLFEYMLQHQAHEILKKETCAAPKPLGFIRYRSAPNKPVKYFLVSQFCAVYPGAMVSVTLEQVLQYHSTTPNPLLTMVDYKNVIRYLILGFEKLAEKKIYHNNVHSQHILLQFYENSVLPVIIDFSECCREKSYKIRLRKTFYEPEPDDVIEKEYPYVAPELFEELNPRKTSDLYGISYVILRVSGMFGLQRTQKVITKYRNQSGAERSAHKKAHQEFKLLMLKAMNKDLYGGDDDSDSDTDDTDAQD